MKSLKIILGILYPLLIVLLLLSNCRGFRKALCEKNVVEQAQQIGQSGNLKITLLWNFQGDIDLHVTQPNGETISYNNEEDPSTGGFLDVDNTSGGNGSAENIYWETPPKGKYKVFLHYYQSSSSTDIAERGTCSVVIFQEGKSPQSYFVEMNDVGNTKNVVEFTIE